MLWIDSENEEEIVTLQRFRRRELVTSESFIDYKIFCM